MPQDLKCLSKLQCHPRNSCGEVAVVPPRSLTSPWPDQGLQASMPSRLMSSSSLNVKFISHDVTLPYPPAQSSLKCPFLLPDSSFLLSVLPLSLSSPPFPFPSIPFLPNCLCTIPWHFLGEAACSWKELWLPCPV